MYANGPISTQKPPKVFHMYRREHRDQLSFKDFFLSFGGQLSGDNDVTPFAGLVLLRAGGCQAAFHCWMTSRGVRPWSAECGL